MKRNSRGFTLVEILIVVIILGILAAIVIFGLLGFYLLMLPRLGKAFAFDEWWRPAVSVLNLTAIAMALAYLQLRH